MKKQNEYPSRFIPIILILVGFSFACSVPDLKDQDWSVIKKNEEFDKMVSIKEIPHRSATGANQSAAEKDNKATQKQKKSTNKKKSESSSVPTVSTGSTPGVHEPEIERKEGFVGRRPLQDPFRVGERVKLKVTYFAIPAGTMILEVLPFVEVNGRKSYQFAIEVKSHSSFAWIYQIHNRMKALLDYEKMIPYGYTMDSKESKKIAQEKVFFDWNHLQGNYWEKKVISGNPEEENKIQWAIEPFTQTVFSAPFYMRAFQLKPDTEINFRIGNKGNNLIFKGKVLRKEQISTGAGTFDTIVMEPEFHIGGTFQPVGKITIWMTDDDRKMIVRMECKIKIGALTLEAEEFTSEAKSDDQKNGTSSSSSP